QTDLASDTFADGELDDTVLESFDAASGTLISLCPAEDVVVAAGRAAFLRPESAVGTAACPGGSLNADADLTDLVVQLWQGSGPVLNLGKAATAIAISPTHVAALVSEAGEGSDLNGDGDAADRVLQVYDAVARMVLPVTDLAGRHQPATDFVLGTTVVAFRTREGDLCGTPATPENCANPPGCPVASCDLNGDGDCCDDVLQAYDLVAHRLVNSGAEVIPCAFEACDPRAPYRVLGGTVRFLTYECAQGGTNYNGCPSGGTDLNGDGDAGDLVI